MWQSEVYRLPNPIPLPDDWQKIRSNIFRRDKKRCQICLVDWNDERLTVHHIISRELGGDNQDSNLITLCLSCHDDIEVQEFDNYKEFWEYIKKQRDYFEQFREENKYIINIKEESPDDIWPKWVYGAYRKPSKSKIKDKI